MTHEQVLDLIDVAKYVFVKSTLTQNSNKINDHVRIDKKEAYRLIEITEADNKQFGSREKLNYIVSGHCFTSPNGNTKYLFALFLGE